MRIAFNATPLLSPLTGIGQYIYQLATTLQTLPDVDLDLFYGYRWDKEIRQQPLPGITEIRSAVKRVIPNIYVINRHVQQFKFNRLASSKQIDLYHEPCFLAFKCNKPTVLTVLDLSWIRFPETHPQQRIEAMDRYFEPSLRRATNIITISEFVKREVIDVFGIAKERIHAIPLAVESDFKPRQATETQSTLDKYGLKHGQYLLSVGTLEPRKNLQVVLKAYQRLPESVRKHYPLVIVGMKGWKTSALEQQIAPLVAAGEIKLLGFLPREDLTMVTAGALSMLYLSVYEGFGFPPLEAMACSVPVIASDVASMPEVVGDSGFLQNPHDEILLSENIQMLIEDHDLRNTTAMKGLQRSQQFSWEKCARETLALYKKTL